MEIISLEFFRFVLISLVVYYQLPGRFQNFFLLAASGYFLASWDIGYILFISLFILVNYYGAKIIAGSEKRRRTWLWLILSLNFFAFIVYQYRYVINSHLVKASYSYDVDVVRSILMPIGLSYYFLEAVSYLLDVYRKWMEPGENLIDFALYLAYFPKLISGPIERARVFLPMLKKKRTVDSETVENSIGLIIFGLIRSVIFAGMLNIFTDRGSFSEPLEFSSTALVVGIFIYAFKLYNNFAGYTSIVRGVSGLFGIPLSRNFAQPFFSKDFSDLWTRWHISLSQWLRDYIYMPISRSLLRKNPRGANLVSLVAPPLVTMVASGVWHGTRGTLLLWGVLNGGFLVLENLINLIRKTNVQFERSWRRRLIGMAIAFPLAFAAAIPFRMDWATSRVFLYGIIKANQWTIPDWRPFLMIGLVLGFDYVQFKTKQELFFKRWPQWLQAVLLTLVLFAVFVVNELQTALSTFIYP